MDSFIEESRPILAQSMLDRGATFCKKSPDDIIGTLPKQLLGAKWFDRRFQPRQPGPCGVFPLPGFPRLVRQDQDEQQGFPVGPDVREGQGDLQVHTPQENALRVLDLSPDVPRSGDDIRDAVTAWMELGGGFGKPHYATFFAKLQAGTPYLRVGTI